jgi:hypothetical protein
MAQPMHPQSEQVWVESLSLTTETTRQAVERALADFIHQLHSGVSCALFFSAAVSAAQ